MPLNATLAMLLCLAAALPHPHRFDRLFRGAWGTYFRDLLPNEDDWLRFKAQGLAENFQLDPDITAYDGGMGLMQIDPRTADWRNIPLEYIYEPRTNIYAGVDYDRWIWDYLEHKVPGFHSLIDHLYYTFAGYNSGPGSARKAKSLARSEGLDDGRWESATVVYSRVTGHWSEVTLAYIERIRRFSLEMIAMERLVRTPVRELDNKLDILDLWLQWWTTALTTGRK